MIATKEVGCPKCHQLFEIEFEARCAPCEIEYICPNCKAASVWEIEEVRYFIVRNSSGDL